MVYTCYGYFIHCPCDSELDMIVRPSIKVVGVNGQGNIYFHLIFEMWKCHINTLKQYRTKTTLHTELRVLSKTFLWKVLQKTESESKYTYWCSKLCFESLPYTIQKTILDSSVNKVFPMKISVIRYARDRLLPNWGS